MSKKNYFIVAPSPWDASGLKYRRHRLAEFLLEQEDTKSVIWIYAAIQGIRHPFKIIKILNRKSNILNNGIKEVRLPDIRKSILLSKNTSLLKKHLQCFIDTKANDQNILWYTAPVYPALINNFDWNKIIYDCSDRWGEPWEDKKGLKNLEKHINNRRLHISEKYISQKSNKIFATSTYLKDYIYKISGKNATVIENGVDYKLFTESSPNNFLDYIPKPRIGFVGGMKPKIDFNLVLSLAKSRVEWSIVLIGPKTNDFIIPEFEELVKLPNVYHVNGVDFNEVPQYMKSLDVGLQPYKKIEYNKAVSPLKLFEYMAAGLPVVGIGVPETERYSEEGIYYYGNTSELFIENCEKALNSNYNKRNEDKRVNIASKHSWEEKFLEMQRLSKM